MKTLIATMCIVLVAIFVVGCASSAEKEQVAMVKKSMHEREIAEQNQNTVDMIVNNSVYIKDPRTGLCYICRQSNTAYDFRVTTLATVPCEAVPSTLLITGRIRTK